MPYNHDSTSVEGPIRIVEVGPRDGLQNERAIVSTDLKVAFIQSLSRTGVAEIECSSFVSPTAIPQLADAEEVFRRLERPAGVEYSALVANERGLDRAQAVGVGKIAVVTAASDSFTTRNINATVRESLERFTPLVARAKQAGMNVRGYISTVVCCPYEGRITPAKVVDVMDALLQSGVDEISLGETIGTAAPADIRRLLDVVLPHVPLTRLAMHFHDTYGMAIANALTAWHEYGVQTFDSSAGGLGGCPYASGAAGNVATEDLVYALKASGGLVQVDESLVVEAAWLVAGAVGRSLTSRRAQIERRTASLA